MSGTDLAEARAEVLRRRAVEAALWVPTSGTSMGMDFPDGTDLLVEVRERPRLGEVWVYCERGGDLVAHRYMRRAGSRFVFRGDARRSSDTPVDKRCLVGKAVRRRREGRHQTISRVPWFGLVARSVVARVRRLVDR